MHKGGWAADLVEAATQSSARNGASERQSQRGTGGGARAGQGRAWLASEVAAVSALARTSAVDSKGERVTEYKML